MTKVAKWARVTDNKFADTFPDVWISGAESYSLDVKSLGDKDAKEPKQKDAITAQTPVRETPEASSNREDSLVIRWDNAKSDNKVGGLVARVNAKGRARFGRHYEMVLGGGYLKMREETLQPLLDARKAGASTVQFLVIPWTSEDGVFYNDAAGMVVFVEDGAFQVRYFNSAFKAGPVSAGTAAHIAVSGTGETCKVYRDGKLVTEKAEFNIPPLKAQHFGDGTWEGGVEYYSVHKAALGEEAIASTAKPLLEKAAARKPVPRLRLKGKLTEISEASTKQEYDAYERAVVVYAYDVEEVLEGEYAEKQIPVVHWVYMDRQFLKSMPRKIGESSELTVEPFLDHPQLKSEYLDHGISIFDLPQWFDITTPQP